MIDYNPFYNAIVKNHEGIQDITTMWVQHYTFCAGLEIYQTKEDQAWFDEQIRSHRCYDV